MKLESESVLDKIRILFELHPEGISIRELAREAIASGIFDETQLEGFQLEGVMKRCRDALRRRDEHGVPYAAQVDKSEDRWQQREFWDYPTAVLVFQSRADQIGDDYTALRALQAWIRQRFGTAPSLPTFA